MSLFSGFMHTCPPSVRVPVSELVKSLDPESPGPEVCCVLERDQDATISPGALVFHGSKSGYTDRKEASGSSTH